MEGPVMLNPRDVLILAEAYEVKPRQVLDDSASVQVWCWSALELLVHMRDKYGWHVSTAIYYVASLRRAIGEARTSQNTWPID